MDFDQIMSEITAGLTGDEAKDIPYLEGQAERYKDSEYAMEVGRACGRLLFEIIPEEKRKELGRLLQKQGLAVDATLDEIRFNIYKHDYDKALKLMEALITKIEDLGLFRDDTQSEYHTFTEPFEEWLYEYHAKPSKTLRDAEIPYSMIYLQYGNLLVEMKRYDEAGEALQKAMHWNPASCAIRFEYMETLKASGNMDEFRKLTLDTFRYAFKPESLARCYRNLGYYFSEKGLWSEAIAAYLLSFEYDPDARNAQSELYYIHHKTNGTVPEPTAEQIRSYAEQYGFPIGPDEGIVDIAVAYGSHFLDMMMDDAARYCLKIAYDLDQSDLIRELYDSIPASEGD